MNFFYTVAVVKGALIGHWETDLPCIRLGVYQVVTCASVEDVISVHYVMVPNGLTVASILSHA